MAVLLVRDREVLLPARGRPGDEDVEIDDNDLRIDTFRSSGAGGQHVNKTSSAVRLTHLPTGEAVQCQNERSQHKNRATAHKMLRARLARLEEERRESEQADKYRDQARVGFGSQIRNYFLHPDQRVIYLDDETPRVDYRRKRGLVEVRCRHRGDEVTVTGGVVDGVRGRVLGPSDVRRGVRSSRTEVGDFELKAQAVIVTSGGIGGG